MNCGTKFWLTFDTIQETISIVIVSTINLLRMKYSKVYMILKLYLMFSFIVMIWICKGNSRYLCSGSYCFDFFDKMCDIFLAHSNNGIFLFVTEMLQNIFSHFYPWKNLMHDWKRYRNNDIFYINHLMHLSIQSVHEKFSIYGGML